MMAIKRLASVPNLSIGIHEGLEHFNQDVAYRFLRSFVVFHSTNFKQQVQADRESETKPHSESVFIDGEVRENSFW